MKYRIASLALFAVVLGAFVVNAAQTTTLTQRQVRDPRKLEAILEANASDAQTRIAAVEAGTLSSGLTVSGGGVVFPYANKTANYTNTASDVVLSYNTSAATTNTLPRAHTVYGKLLCVALQDDDGDLVVATTGTDTFDGSNDQITFADAGDSCWLMATATNVYTILVNVGGTLGTQ